MFVCILIILYTTEGISLQELKEMFKKFDKDNSGTIEFEEFLQTLRVRCCVMLCVSMCVTMVATHEPITH